MDSVSAGSGGGIHPGAPIIWPTIKPTTSSTESTTKSPTQSQSQSASQAQSAATARQSSSSSAATSSSSIASPSNPNLARTLSTQDISAQLMSVGLADTPENQQLASKMLEYGMELSNDNFSQVFKAMQNKGSNQNTQTAAFTALAKGMAASQPAVQSLEQFFSGNNNLSSQLNQLTQSMSDVSQAMSGKNLLNPGVMASLASVLSEFDQNIKKMKNTSDPSKTISFSKDQKSLLQGLLGDTNKTALLPAQRNALQKMLSGGFLSSEEMLSLQSMLSKEGMLSGEQAQMLNNILKEAGGFNLELSKNFLKDLTALKAFISGIQQQLAQSKNPAERENLMALLKELEASIGGVMDNFTAQAVLSKLSKYYDPNFPDKYSYWMIPNPFVDKKNIEILIKRDSSKKEAPINPAKTQLIMKIETENFGDVAVIVEISGKELWYLFNTESDDARKYIAANAAALREQMSNLDFQVKGFNSQVKKIEINKILSPTLDLDNLRRIKTEA